MALLFYTLFKKVGTIRFEGDFSPSLFTRLRASIRIVLFAIVGSACSVCISHGLSEERIHHISHEIENEPNNANLYLKRGRIHFDSEHWQQALLDFNKALAINSKISDALYWKGKTLINSKQLERAKETLNQYIEKETESPAGYSALAEIYTLEGDFEVAANYYDRSIQLDPNAPPQVFIQRTHVLRKVKPLPLRRIIEGLNQGLLRFGQNPTLIEQIVLTHEMKGDFPSAILAIGQLPEALKNTPSWQLKKANLLFESGEAQPALSEYRKVINTIDRLPSYRKTIPAIKQVESFARSRINEISQTIN